MSFTMVSVVMPVYNAEKYLSEAVESILNQTYSDFEFIIIDDCSTDNSYNILLNYAQKDSRIRLFKNEVNSKLPKTLNFGISLANGKYIIRMDADDISLPERFAKQIEFMETHQEIGVCASNCEIYDEKMERVLEITKYPSQHELIKIYLHLFVNPIVHPSIMIRRVILLKNNFFYDNNMVGLAEDYDLWLRMVDSNIKFANLSQALIKYRSSVGQVSKANEVAINAWRAVKIRQYLNHLLLNDMDGHELANQYIKNLIFPERFWYLKIFAYVRLIKRLNEANAATGIYQQKFFELFLKRISFFNRIRLKLGI